MRLLRVTTGLLLFLVAACSAPTTPSRQPAEPRPESGRGDVQVEEQRIGLAVGKYPWELDLIKRVRPDIAARLQAEAAPIAAYSLENTNRTLAQFGFSLKPRGHQPGAGYDLYRGSEPVVTDLAAHLPRIVVNKAGDDFAFVTYGRGGAILVRRNAVIPGKWYPDIPPIFVDRDLVALQVQYPSGHVLPNQPIPWQVWREGHITYTANVREKGANPRVKRLTAWGSHWVLEVDGDVVIDGEPMAPSLGYTQVFEWQLLKGRPFYFFVKDRTVRVSYGESMLAHRYDEIIHYKCCEPTLYNPTATDRSVAFWARRDGAWNFVVFRVAR